MVDNQVETAAKPARSSLKERQRQERADLILQVAEEVLTEKGYHDTTIDEIAARVGIAKGTVYLHFPSKIDLVIALFDRDANSFLEFARQVAQTPGSARVRLEHILRHAYEGMRGKRTQLFMSLLSSTSVRNELIEKRGGMGEHVTLLARVIETILEEGKAAGQFDATIPTPVLLRTFLVLLSPRSFEPLIGGEQLSPEELVTYVGRIYFQGIISPTSQS
ncbi:MAG TPA: TetR/AcrR family transcriptional regulator [Herpetosiphonaceae bacterium]